MERTFNIQGNYIEQQIINVNDGGVLNMTCEEPQTTELKDDMTARKAVHRNFGLMMHSGHTPTEIDAAMERLRIMCRGNNSRALMRLLVELDKDGFIQIDDVKANELYNELIAAFDLPSITRSAFTESFRLIG